MFPRLHRRFYFFPVFLLSMEWLASLLVLLWHNAPLEEARQCLLLAGAASGTFPLVTGIGAWFALPRDAVNRRGSGAIHGILQTLVLLLYGVFAWDLWENETAWSTTWPLLGLKTLLLAMLFGGSYIGRKFVRRQKVLE